MKIILVFLAVCLHQAVSQGCVDYHDWCSSYVTVCHEVSYRHIVQQCQKTCINMCQNPPKSRLPSGNCGNPQVQTSRVIGGKTAKAGAWPWQILLMFNGKPMCGGSLISSRWVLTAAHCVNRFKYYFNYFKVRVGEHDVNVTEGNEQDFRLEKLFVHPSYIRYLLRNDIALLKLKTPIVPGKFASPVCLPSQGEKVDVGTECFITGWGKIKHPGTMHNILQQGKIPVITNSLCDYHNYQNTGVPVTSTMICAGHGPGSKLSGCHGDSGGPFVCRNKSTNNWVLQGAVSWGSRTCETSKSYTVFARVAEFRNWIDQIVSEN